MQEGKSSGGDGGSAGGGESSRAPPKLLKAGDRQLITVELRPGDTTYVSWRKLMRDANKVNGSASQPDPPSNANPNLESRLAPVQPAENEMKEQAQPNRFSAVIEKIERLYMGKDSSEGEELDSAPDDDEYDTEDSFIDDAELDEYFEVDNSAIKHDGFFVNRGKLERISEPPTISNQQLKKRRRRDLDKAHNAMGDVRVSSKQVKVPRTTGGKITPSLVKNSNPPQSYVVKHSGKQTAEVLQPKNITGNKLKEATGSSEPLHPKYSDRSAYPQSKSQLGKLPHNDVELEAALHQKETKGIRELPDLNISAAKYPVQTSRSMPTCRKENSSARPKISVLEKAIRELEKAVAESRPPAAMENQEADASSQAVKRRLPREVKLKLAKVAKIAASQGKVSKELINRLMSIVGHLIQLRSLKRNLKIMINVGVSASQERDDRFQQIKKEVVEMINTRVPLIESQASEQQSRASDDFQEPASGERASLKRKFVMDSALEDKICDLYDIYVDGLEEDAGPQIRKLYVELAELWPNRLMDNHGIKRAICRAKERKRAMYGKEMNQVAIKRKKPSAPKPEATVRTTPTSASQQQPSRVRPVTDSGSQSSPSGNKQPPSTTASVARVPSPSRNETSSDRLKEKAKGGSSSSNPGDEPKTGDASVAKKTKRKAESESKESHPQPEKSTVQSGEDVNKSLKQLLVLPLKQNNLPFDGPDLNKPC